jgi:hypothetical protein
MYLRAVVIEIFVSAQFRFILFNSGSKRICICNFFPPSFGLLEPPLSSNGQSSCLQIQMSGFDFLRYQIFWEAAGLERGPLSLVSTIEELLERKSSGSGLQNREYVCRDPLCWPRNTLYPQTLSLPSSTSGGRGVGIVRSGTLATELSFLFFFWPPPPPL